MWLFNIFLSLILFFLGASIASFWAVVNYREEKKLSWLKGRSFCEKCQKKIKWYDNIPIISFLLLKGKCRDCQIVIPPKYFWWEFLLGGWCLMWFWVPVIFNLGESMNFSFLVIIDDLLLLVVGAILIWTAIVDIYTHEIDNFWLKNLGLLSLLHIMISFFIFELSWIEFSYKIGGNVIIVLVYVLLNKISQLLWKKEGLGSGDAWIFIILSWWLSGSQLLIMFLFSFWLGAIGGVSILSIGRKIEQNRLAFLPFVNLAFLIAYYMGEMIFNWCFHSLDISKFLL